MTQWKINPVADVASVVVKALETDTYLRRTVVVAD